MGKGKLGSGNDVKHAEHEAREQGWKGGASEKDVATRTAKTLEAGGHKDLAKWMRTPSGHRGPQPKK